MTRWMYTKDKIPHLYGDLVRPDFIGRIISPEDIERLGGTWYETPTELLAEPEVDEKSFLQLKLDEAGVKYDKRAGVAKLKELLDDHRS